MAEQDRLCTVDEFWETFGETKRLELVKGIPTEMAPTGTAHGAVSLRLGHLILGYIEEHDLGLAVGAETGFLLAQNPDTVRAPDVGFAAQARLPDPIPVQYFPGPPDLAVEVVSPNDSATSIHDIVLDYLHAGTRLVWKVYPEAQHAAAYASVDEAHICGVDAVLDGGEVLPASGCRCAMCSRS
ncbi:MAG TPA: Uma2 family endonuclease [Aggregatilineaceae bacterium]|nr:Uma2 family endonuclease [Aggregatilineaceae bacterium]